MRSAFLVVSAVLMVAACGEDPGGLPTQDRPPQRNFTVQETQLADATVGFGLRLYQRVVANDNQPNVMISPLSASMALGMTMNGALDGTYDAMRSTLGFGNMAEPDINQAYHGLMEQLLARAPHISLEVANAIWHERTFTVKQPFTDAARNFFDAEVSALDFASPASVNTINNWVERKTAGRIRNLLDQIQSDEIMFLVNAVYFKAPWKNRFKSESTRNGNFTRANGSTVSVPLMSQELSAPMAQTAEVTAVELPYADSAFSMVLLLPAENTQLSALEARLSTSWWNTLTASLRTAKMQLTLPRFKFEFDAQLNDPLTQLGMGIAFSDVGANFSRIADDQLYITRVKQKTFIEVNEAGSEAAAATIIGVGVVCACGPTPVSFTRPFLFAIRERSTGALMFLGRVGDPSAS